MRTWAWVGGRAVLVAAGVQMILLSICRAQEATPLRLKPHSTADVWQLGFKTLVMAVLFLGSAAACLYGWRAWQRGRGITLANAPGVQVESARRISQKTTLLTIQWQGRRYLLAENAGATRVIDSRVIEGTQL